jgi:hypothetical protein
MLQPSIHPQIYADYTDEKMDSPGGPLNSVTASSSVFDFSHGLCRGGSLDFRTFSAVGRIKILSHSLTR